MQIIKPKSSCMFCLFIYIKPIFKSSFRITGKLRGRYRDFPYTPCPYKHNISSLSTSPSRMVHCYNWWTYIDIITLSLYLMQQFSLGGGYGYGHSMGILWVWTDVPPFCGYGQMYHHFGIFSAIKILCTLPVHTSPWQPLIFLLTL